MRKIIGCGNLLLQDEGVGVHLIEYLKKKPLPEDIECIDGGCAGFDLLPHFEQAEKVVIVDAVKAKGKPGDIYKFGPEDFQTDSPPRISFHDVTLKEVLDILKKLGPLPAITIFGVEPKTIEWGMELSPDIQNILPKLADLVLKEI
jgi:hydrogenase maturation protease